MQVTTNIPMSRREAYLRGFQEGVKESIETLIEFKRELIESRDKLPRLAESLIILERKLLMLINKQAIK